MSLKKAIQGATRKAFKAGASVRKEVTYTRKASEATHDDETGDLVRLTEGTCKFKCFLINYDKEEIDGKVVQSADRRAIFQTEDFTFKPKVTDEITDDCDIIWSILNIHRETSESMTTMQLRQP